MKTAVIEIRERGKNVKVPSVNLEGIDIIATGKWLKIAGVHDEEWIEGQVENPGKIAAELKQNLKADIFTFLQKLPDTVPKHVYPMEWDNLAVIRITNYQDWWEKLLPQVTRKSIRRGFKLGVTARVVEFGDEFVKGIVDIHNDAQTRQGLPFFHYGKDFHVVKHEYGTFPERSIFIGAYHDQELIGMIKLVRINKCGSIMQIITKTRHYDKRPTNILIAKAVEVCEQEKLDFLVYRKYIYGNKTDSSLTEFKRRNGFEKVNLPRYYIPLTLKGRLAMKLKLHLGLASILPNRVINLLRDVRARYYRIVLRFRNAEKKDSES